MSCIGRTRRDARTLFSLVFDVGKLQANVKPAPSSNQGTSSGHIKGLDGLRAIAATVVFVFHVWGHWQYPAIVVDLFGNQVDITWIFHYGTEGVSIFFVLSGFLLSIPFWRALLTNGRPVNVSEFFKRRFLRIYPAYLVALVIFALFFDVNHPLLVRLIQFTSHLFLVHNLSELTIYSDASPLWSVATEFQMYLLLPVLFILIALYVKSNGRPWLAALVLFVASGLLAVVFYALANVYLPALQLDPNWLKPGGNVIPHLPIIGLAYFASGIAFGYVYLKLRDRVALAVPAIIPELIAIAIIVTVAEIASTGLSLAGLTTETWPRLALLYGVLVVAVALGGRTFGVTWLLESAPIRFIGMISYSFYLYHDYVLYLVFDRLPNLAFGALSNGVVKMLLAYGITLVISTISYYAIETRFHRTASEKTRPAPLARPVTRPNQAD